MALLELERVSKRFGSGLTERVVLREVSLRVDSGELVAVWGGRRSGRSTLVRIAAGITDADSGVVRFEGHDLGGRDGDARREAIGYCMTAPPREAQVVLEQLVADQLIRGTGIEEAERQARGALRRTGAERCAAVPFRELDPAEIVRVAIARALAHAPKLIVIDEPTVGVEILARDGILALLRSLAEEGLATLMTTGETPCLSGADQAWLLDEGELRGNPPRLAPVLRLRHSA